jgi:hypothetical protein
VLTPEELSEPDSEIKINLDNIVENIKNFLKESSDRKGHLLRTFLLSITFRDIENALAVEESFKQKHFILNIKAEDIETVPQVSRENQKASAPTFQIWAHKVRIFLENGESKFLEEPPSGDPDCARLKPGS